MLERQFSLSENIERRVTRAVRVGNVVIGGDAPIAVQSMAATHTSNVEATALQVNMLHEAGAKIVRLAVDSMRDVEALAEIRLLTESVSISIDLQENYRLAKPAAPYIDKFRFNPGHLYHHERNKSYYDKIAWLAEIAGKHSLAIRSGVNCGSIEPELADKFGSDYIGAAVESALRSSEALDRAGFTNYVVSIKDSDPKNVVEANMRFAALRPEVPLHLGLTEAGTPSTGIYKSRLALEPLLRAGIGETLRVSLTLKFNEKDREVMVGRQIIDEVFSGKSDVLNLVETEGLNLISCPSCSRVENEDFVELAQYIDEMRVDVNSRIPKGMRIDVAVMGCRVNGPGETDHADLGLWCGPAVVRLKRKEEEIGVYSYEEIRPRFSEALEQVISEKGQTVL